MTDVAKHSFSLTDHGSVGPLTRSLCSAEEEEDEDEDEEEEGGAWRKHA